MAVLPQNIVDQLKEEFEKLPAKAKLKFFTQTLECQYCKDIEAMLKEIAEISDKIELDIHNYSIDKELVKKFDVKMYPAIIPLGVDDEGNEIDYGIKIYGIPAGYEFTSLIESIRMVSKKKSQLSDNAREKIKEFTKPVNIQVFVTPSCPYCPGAVIIAHSLAVESDLVTSEMIEATEFPELSNKFRVQGVPRTVLNEDVMKFFEGAFPEDMAIKEIIEKTQQ